MRMEHHKRRGRVFVKQENLWLKKMPARRRAKRRLRRTRRSCVNNLVDEWIMCPSTALHNFSCLLMHVTRNYCYINDSLLFLVVHFLALHVSRNACTIARKKYICRFLFSWLILSMLIYPYISFVYFHNKYHSFLVYFCVHLLNLYPFSVFVSWHRRIRNFFLLFNFFSFF